MDNEAIGYRAGTYTSEMVNENGRTIEFEVRAMGYHPPIADIAPPSVRVRAKVTGNPSGADHTWTLEEARELHRLLSLVFPATAILALQSSERGEGECIAIPRKLFNFLMGTGEIDGTSFGELADGLPGRFWWRALLKTAEDQTFSPAEPSPESREGVGLTADEMTRLIGKFAQAADFTTVRDRKIYDTLLVIRAHKGDAA